MSPDALLEGLRTMNGIGLPLLLDVAVKGFLVLIVAALVTSSMRKTSAAARHFVWLLALTNLLALPMASLTLPAWRVLPHWMQVEPPDQAAASAPLNEKLPSIAPSMPLDASLYGNTGALHKSKPFEERPPTFHPAIDHVNTAAAFSPGSVASVPTPTSQVGFDRVRPLLVQAWLFGVLICLLPLLAGQVGLWLLQRRAGPLTCSQWRTLLHKASIALRLNRRVELLQSSQRTMPMVWGLWRARLLLPEEADGWSPACRRTVLLHELAHVKRHDCLTKLLGQIACATYWYNPLVWYAARRMQREAEHACDDMVLRAGSNAHDYAEHILNVAAHLQTGMLAPHGAIGMARPGKLEGRLLAILNKSHNRRALTLVSALVVLLLSIGVVLPIAAMSAAQPTTVASTSEDDADAVSASPAGAMADVTAVDAESYVTIWERDETTEFGKGPRYGFHRLQLASTIPAALRGVPGEDAHYAELALDDAAQTTFLCGVARSSAELPGDDIYDICFVDADRDHVITENEVMRSERFGLLYIQDNRCFVYDYGAVTLQLQDADGPRDHVVLFGARTIPHSAPAFHAQSRCYTRTTIKLGEQEASACLIDFNCDGRFDTVSPDGSESDYVWVDLNFDQRTTAAERAYVGGLFPYGEHFYHITTASDGSRLTVRPYAGPVGKLRVPFESGRIEFRTGESRINVGFADSNATLPCDVYELEKYTTTVDKSDATWNINGFYDPTLGVARKKIQIAEDSATELLLGTPMRGILVAEIGEEDGAVSFLWSTRGAADEHLSVRGPESTYPMPPTLEIRNAVGRIVASGTMRGLGGDAAQFRWTPPSHLPFGFYTASVDCRSWPVPVEKAECTFELTDHHQLGTGEKEAPQLTPDERSLLKELVRLVQVVESEHGEFAFCRGPRAFIIRSASEITQWEVNHYGKKEDTAESEVGYGDSRLASARADYYLLDGTPLKSRWRPRGDSGMHDIRIDIGRPVPEDQRVFVAHRTTYETDRLLMTRDGSRLALPIHLYEDAPSGVVVRAYEPVDIQSWAMNDAERHTLSADLLQLTCLLPPSPTGGLHMIWFTDPTANNGRRTRASIP